MPLHADRLCQIREKKGLTQRNLAEICDVTIFQISRLETGKGDTTGRTLEAIADNLDVSMDYLYGRVEQPNGLYREVLTDDHLKLIEAYEAGDSTAIMALMLERVRQIEGSKSS